MPGGSLSSISDATVSTAVILYYLSKSGLEAACRLPRYRVVEEDRMGLMLLETLVGIITLSILNYYSHLSIYQENSTTCHKTYLFTF